MLWNNLCDFNLRELLNRQIEYGKKVNLKLTTNASALILIAH